MWGAGGGAEATTWTGAGVLVSGVAPETIARGVDAGFAGERPPMLVAAIPIVAALPKASDETCAARTDFDGGSPNVATVACRSASRIARAVGHRVDLSKASAWSMTCRDARRHVRYEARHGARLRRRRVDHELRGVLALGAPTARSAA